MSGSSAQDLSERLRRTALHVRPESTAPAPTEPPSPAPEPSARPARTSTVPNTRRAPTRGVRKPTTATQEDRPPMRRYTMNLPPEDWRSLRVAAADAGVDASVLMRELLRLLVEDPGIRRRVFGAVGRP
jgi:hypothetical protein